MPGNHAISRIRDLHSDLHVLLSSHVELLTSCRDLSMLLRDAVDNGYEPESPTDRELIDLVLANARDRIARATGKGGQPS